MKRLFPLLVILLLAPWPVAYAQRYNGDIAGQDAVQLALVGPSITSGVTSAQGSSRSDSFPIPKIRDYVENNPNKEFPFRLFVTPEDEAIKALAAQIDGAADAYLFRLLRQSYLPGTSSMGLL